MSPPPPRVQSNTPRRTYQLSRPRRRPPRPPSPRRWSYRMRRRTPETQDLPPAPMMAPARARSPSSRFGPAAGSARGSEPRDRLGPADTLDSMSPPGDDARIQPVHASPPSAGYPSASLAADLPRESVQMTAPGAPGANVLPAPKPADSARVAAGSLPAPAAKPLRSWPAGTQVRRRSCRAAGPDREWRKAR